MPFQETLTKVRVVLRDRTLTYDTFQEAKAEFPDLNIYRGSRSFTSALDDIDALRFECWEVHNALDED